MPPAITVNYMVPIGGAGLSLSAIHQWQDEDEMTKAWRAAIVTHFQVCASAQSSSYFTLLFQASNFFWKSNEIKKKNNFYFQILWCKPQIHKWKCGLKSHSSSLETGSYFISFTSAHFIDGFWGHRECHKAGTWAVRQPDRFYTNPQFKLIT